VQSLRYAVLNLDDATGAVWAEELTQRNSSASLHAHSPLSNFPPQAGERANDPLRGNSTPEVVAYGLTDAAVQHARSLGLRMVHGNLLANSANGLQLVVQSDWGTARLDSQLLGRFNAENLLGVLAVLLLSGVTLPEAIACLAKVTAVAGRMQRLGEKHTPTVIVDYAHTPDALEKVLQTLREVMAQSGGKLCCVFGCGGNRDNGKRPMMGKVAEQFADQIIVTSDNPRDELPTEIAAQIVQGMTEKKHRVMLDRADAINYAIAHAQACDTVLIAGKGHEEYQEIHGAKYPFSDVKIAKIALQNWPLEVRV
jgi:UDP-N-acetylmuramoyl-L-alanyl-D-glutamate--2,6-diaminopimelate ligase